MNKNLLKPSIFFRLAVNKTRSFLTIFSLSIAIVCLMISSFVAHVVKETDNVQFLNTDKNTVFLNTTNSSIDYANVAEIGTYFSDCVYNFFETIDAGYIQIGQGDYALTLLGVGKITKKMIMPSFDQYGATENTKLIAGRLIDDNDIKLGRNVILIHNSIGRYIFGSNSRLIGEKIRIVDETYEVVGVLLDTPDIVRITSKLSEKDSAILWSSYKLPLIISGRYATRVNTVVLFFKGAINSSALSNIQEQLDHSHFENIEATNAEAEIRDKSYYGTSSTGIIDISLNIVTIILCIISTVIIFISIRGRANEIAVKKSFGATTIDIVVMFSNEILLCAFVAACYALPISTIIMAFISASITTILHIPIFPLNMEIYMFPVALITFSVSIIEMLPIIILAKTKIVTLLKVS